ncbi:condensation domain-containing protein, partial [Undibacterium sp. TS12]|uniref:condensation domain-containing protein n=1 Tax=Undibacterium sp. TS12 TaxID=2908202 RepID=UPI001F4D1114
MIDFSAQIGAMSSDELSALGKRLSNAQNSANDARLSVRDPGTLVPLSYGQERLWFVEQMGLAKGAFDLSAVLHLDGEIDVSILQRSLDELVRRHEALRTCFETVEGRGIQVITQNMECPLDLQECENLDTTLDQWVESQAKKPYDLAAGPMFRTALLRAGTRKSALMLMMHHIISDGWSIDLLLKELSIIYTAFVQGQPSPLPALSIQYGDYALWQRQWLQGEELNRQLEYWTSKLGSASEALDLPTDKPRPSTASYHAASWHFTIPQALSSALVQFSRQEGASLFMVLMAAYQTLLSRWSGQDDILVGTPIAGRRQRELEELIGFFVNTLVIRSELSETMSFRDLLANVRATALDAYANQDLPFEKIVEALRPVRDLSRHAIFQVWFVLEKMGQATLDFPNIKSSQAPVDLAAT